MSAITKERIELFIKNPLNNGLTRGEQMELARIALASLEAEPIAWECGENIILFNPDTVEAYAKRAEITPKPLFAAPPALVVPDDWQLVPKKITLEMECALSKADSYEIGWLWALAAAPKYEVQNAKRVQNALNACRAAMLQGAESVSQTYRLPQTQFEQVADLYEMQFDDGRTCAFHTDAQKAAQWLQACDGNRVQEYVKLERLQNALSCNSPVTPDGWISCSERMPDDKQYVWFFGESRGFAGRDTFEGYYDWSRNKWWAVTDIGEEPASKVTHWMPLPEPPQEVNHG